MFRILGLKIPSQTHIHGTLSMMKMSKFEIDFESANGVFKQRKKNTRPYFLLNWLFNKDPYNGL